MWRLTCLTARRGGGSVLRPLINRGFFLSGELGLKGAGFLSGLLPKHQSNGNEMNLFFCSLCFNFKRGTLLNQDALLAVLRKINNGNLLREAGAPPFLNPSGSSSVPKGSAVLDGPWRRVMLSCGPNTELRKCSLGQSAPVRIEIIVNIQPKM